MRSEEDLVQTLRTAAAQAGPVDLANGVAGLRRTRRTRRRMGTALAAAAVVLVAGGTTAFLRQQEPAQVASPVPGAIEPVASVWPRALSQVPAVDADGWRTTPVTAVSATELLMYAMPGEGRAERLEIYDTASGRTRVLGAVPYPEKDYYPQSLDVGEKYIAWHAEKGANRERADFWIMPREGGEARRVGEVAADVDRTGIAGDHLVWSLEKGGGVYRMPLTGGTPERLPGSDGLHLSSWPWAHEGETGLNMTKMVNLETGRASAVAIPEGVDMMQCHPQWCAGMRDSRLVVQRVDGSARRTLPGTLVRTGFKWLYGDRFALFLLNAPDRQQPVLYDLSTGTMAAIGPVQPHDTSSRPSSALFWGDGAERTVLNLKAIP
ncbi:hypothetical protein AB0M50_17860 [Nonomuraea fuscirosea]|uniref:hypothetical protein n=1 Tax=Nonomuraea fuscirosea TaxID=1291556 RepID=UPI003445B67A